MCNSICHIWHDGNYFRVLCALRPPFLPQFLFLWPTEASALPSIAHVAPENVDFWRPENTANTARSSSKVVWQIKFKQLRRAKLLCATDEHSPETLFAEKFAFLPETPTTLDKYLIYGIFCWYVY